MGSMNVFASGAWRKAKGAHVFASGAWRKAKAVWVFTGGAWRKMPFISEITMTVGNGVAFGFNSYGYFKSGNNPVFGSITPPPFDMLQNPTEGSGAICVSPNFQPGAPEFLVLAGLIPGQRFNIEIVGFGDITLPPLGATDIVRIPRPGLMDFLSRRVNQQVTVRFTYL